MKDDAEWHETEVEINVTALNKAGRVKFDNAAVQDLLDWMLIWDDERKNVYPPEKGRYYAARRATKKAKALGSKWQAADFVNWGGDKFDPRIWNEFLLGMLANNIEEVWRRRGGKGVPGRNDQWGHYWSGPVTELMLELCKQLNIKPVPGRSTIRHGMVAYADAMAGRPR